MSIEQSNLSIILPVHNEVDSLESVISEWDSSLKNIPGLHHTFLICEDGSTDGTQELVTKFEHHYPIVNNSVSWRRGYGQAVRDGIALAKTDYILCIDSDGQLGPNQFDEVWNRRSENHFLMGWWCPRLDPPVRLVYSKLFKFYHRVLFPNRLHDPSCPFVLGHTNLFKRLTPFLAYMKEGLGLYEGRVLVGICGRLLEAQDPDRGSPNSPPRAFCRQYSGLQARKNARNYFSERHWSFEIALCTSLTVARSDFDRS